MIRVSLIGLFIQLCLSIYIWNYPYHFVKYFVYKNKYKAVKKKHLLRDPEWTYVLNFNVVIYICYISSIMLLLLPETIVVGIFCILTYAYHFNLERSSYTKSITFKFLSFINIIYFIISILLILHVI